MIRYFKFRLELFDPQPACEVYIKRPAGHGWPEQCPPVRAANALGFDILANFDVTFTRKRGGQGGWRAEPDRVIASDFDWSADEVTPGKPLEQQYAWFWQKGQKIPHPISDHVFKELRNQVKVSSFLFLTSDPNEVLLMTDVPNMHRPWRAMSAVIETDWYPASYPWHCVLELDPSQKRIRIKKGEPIARIIPLRRDTYFASPMTPGEFDEFFTRGQDWLATHGTPTEGAAGTMDIQHKYVKQQAKSRFVVRR